MHNIVSKVCQITIHYKCQCGENTIEININTFLPITYTKLNKKDEVNTLLKLYDIYDRHRESILWFLHKLDVQSYEEYEQKYQGTAEGLFHFTAVCGFFELSGVLVNSRLIDQNIYFDVFNPTPYWQKAKLIVEGMRRERPHIYENFELLNKKRLMWRKRRRNKIKIS